MLRFIKVFYYHCITNTLQLGKVLSKIDISNVIQPHYLCKLTGSKLRISNIVSEKFHFAFSLNLWQYFKFPFRNTSCSPQYNGRGGTKSLLGLEQYGSCIQKWIFWILEEHSSEELVISIIISPYTIHFYVIPKERAAFEENLKSDLKMQKVVDSYFFYKMQIQTELMLYAMEESC